MEYIMFERLSSVLLVTCAEDVTLKLRQSYAEVILSNVTYHFIFRYRDLMESQPVLFMETTAMIGQWCKVGQEVLPRRHAEILSSPNLGNFESIL